MPKSTNNRTLSITLLYIKRTEEMIVLVVDPKGREIRVPISLWRSTHLRLSLLRRINKGYGNFCSLLERVDDDYDTPAQSSHAVHVAYSDVKFWMTLHTVSGKRHSHKTLEFFRADLNQLLAVSRRVFIESGAHLIEQRRKRKMAALEAETPKKPAVEPSAD